jgi:hypothetical protein
MYSYGHAFPCICVVVEVVTVPSSEVRFPAPRYLCAADGRRTYAGILRRFLDGRRRQCMVAEQEIQKWEAHRPGSLLE